MSSIHLQFQKGRFLLLIFGIFLVLLAPIANAITKHLSMVGENGQPLKTTLITITSPDGTSTKRVTDDKGILEYDFKKGGVYTLSDPSGYTIKTVSVAGSGLSKPVMIGIAVGAAAVVLLAAGSSSGGGDGGSGSGGSGDGSGSGSGSGSGGGSGGGNEGSLGGTYNVTATVANNPGNLPVLISTLVLQLEIIGTALTIIQTSNNTNFPAQLSGTIVGGSFTASSNGSYGGTSTLFQLAGSISISQNLSFLINIGSDGTLEGGQTLTYNATGTK
ncbi:hypothetical protein BMS3Abin11_02003 [bacterium BMS3Abin11]|nr:hypothetical protein BMS3Abin11_02003 [bacterium BMS3Abin11]GMT41443.1 MAG: hypothetical protein IEMM0001_2178 [bacterium]